MSILSLIETVRVRGGKAPLWHLHLRRLVASCKALGVPFPMEFSVPQGGSDRVHRLMVSARGVRVNEREVGPTRPVRLVTSSVTHRPYPHKTSDRAQFGEAGDAAQVLGADDGLMLTVSGQVAECTIWGLFWWEGETLCAPALELGVLPGVARMRIAELVPIVERKVRRSEVDKVSLFVANAARGIVPVAALDGQAGPPHVATARLQRRFWETT